MLAADGTDANAISVSNPIVGVADEVKSQKEIMLDEGKSEGFSLNVINLSFEPSRISDLFNLANEFTAHSREYLASSKYTQNLAQYIPDVASESSLTSSLQNVSFKAVAGQITAVISQSISERRTLVDLLTQLKYSGVFDGDISLSGFEKSTTYRDNFAFVPMVRIFFGISSSTLNF